MLIIFPDSARWLSEANETEFLSGILTFIRFNITSMETNKTSLI